MLLSLYNKLIYWLDALLKYKYWYVYTVIFTVFVIWVTTYPSYFALTPASHPCPACVNFQEKIDQADHILTPLKYKDVDHMGKTQLRLTVPLIAKLTGIRSEIGMFLIQELLGVIFLIVACLLTFKITGDRILSAIITLSLGFLYAGRAAFVDTNGFTDSFAYCFLIIALFSRNKLILFTSLLLAFFTDERAIVASALVAIYFLAEHIDTNRNKFTGSALFRSRLLYLFIAWVACFSIRFWLSKAYGLHTPSAGADLATVQQWDYIFWEGLQGFWLIVAGAVIYLFTEKRYFVLCLMLFSMLLTMIVTSMVSDITRSVAYIFPVIFVALYFLEKGVSRIQLRIIVMLVCLVSFLSCGSFYVVGGAPYFYQSIPVKVMGKILEKIIK